MHNKLRLKRLRQLKYMMENHNKIFTTVKFNLNLWFMAPKRELCGTDNRCKSAACVLGSAALYDPFIAEGLKLSSPRESLQSYGKMIAEPVYKSWTGSIAGAEFFGLTYSEAVWLFMPDNYKDKKGDDSKTVTRKRVAKRIGILIKQYKNPNIGYLEAAA